MNPPVAHSERRAGPAQGVTLILIAVLPIMAIAALVADLPQLLVVFHAVPEHELWVPMILTLPSLCVALFASIAGVIADRWGRRRLLLAALVLFALLGPLPLLFHSLPAVLASRFVVGIAEACILTSCNALWGDYFDDDLRRKWLSLQQTSGPVFTALLAVAGGALAAIGWAEPFWLYGSGLLICIPAARYLWEPAPSAGRDDRIARSSTPFPRARALRIAGVTFAVSIVFFVLAIQQGRMFAALGVGSPARSGELIMLTSIGALAGAVSFGLLRRRSIGELLALGLFAYGLGFVGISASHGAGSGAIFGTIAQFGSSIVLPALIAWTLGSFEAEHRGRGVGIWGAVFFTGQFLSAPILTLLERWRGGLLPALGILGSVTLLAALAGAWLTRHRARLSNAG